MGAIHQAYNAAGKFFRKNILTNSSAGKSLAMLALRSSGAGILIGAGVGGYKSDWRLSGMLKGGLKGGAIGLGAGAVLGGVGLAGFHSGLFTSKNLMPKDITRPIEGVLGKFL